MVSYFIWDNTMLTKQDFIQALPPKTGAGISEAVVDSVNKILEDPDTRERFKENMISYNSVLKTGKYKITDYISAVMYVSYKLMGNTNLDAFSRAFPDKIARYTRERKNREQINAFVSGYNRTKLVTAIMEQSIIPTHILNQELYQEAINTNAKIMRTAKRDDIRQRAATDLMNHLAPPVDTKIKLDIDVGSGSIMDALREESLKLMEAQRAAVMSGARSAKEIAESNIIDVTPQ